MGERSLDDITPFLALLWTSERGEGKL